MKAKIFTVIVFLILGTSISIFAQQGDKKDIELSKLINVYSNLEYNTLAFNDLKNKWIISDPMLVREIYNRFIVHDALREKGRKLSVDEIRQKTFAIQSGNVLILLRKRYYDNEIEYFAFVPYSEISKQNPRLLVDSVDDGFYLKSIIGNRLYKKIQAKSYFFSGITKKIFDVKAGYYFNLYLDLLEPNVMFWSTTSQRRNKYLISAFGKWGCDEIGLPGWHLRNYIMGMKLTYYDVVASDLDDYTYEVSAGVGMPSNTPYLSTLPKLTKLFKSGQDFYIRISGQPFKTLFPNFRNFFLDFELDYNVFNYKYSDYKIHRSLKFDSFKNFFVFKIYKKKIFNIFNLGMFKAGLGVSSHDIYRLQIDPTTQSVIDLDATKGFIDKFTNYAFSEIGIEKFGGLIQYDTDLLMAYNFVKGYPLVGVKAKFMISDSFGLDVRYYQTFGFKLQDIPWRTDTYFVFSPILKINY